MADTTSQQPYQFGDVVDGYRWTITGWEPLDPPERTVGVPRLLEARYAATQRAQAAEQARSSAPPVVVHDDEESQPAIDLESVLNRRVVAAPDLAVEFDEPVAETAEASYGSPEQITGEPEAGEPFSVEPEGIEAAGSPGAGQLHGPGALDAPEPEPEPGERRAWYGLGWETIEDDADAPFAAALALGHRALAEQHTPSEIEIAAGLASATAAGRDQEPWTPAPWEQVDEWSGTTDASTPPGDEPLDAHTLAYSAGLEPESEATLEPGWATEAEAQAEQVQPDPSAPTGPTPEPPAGWYPGSTAH